MGDELKAGDHVQVASYDSDPETETVRVVYEVAQVEYVGRRSVTVEYLTGPLVGQRACVMANTLQKLNGVIDVLGATGEAGSPNITMWKTFECPDEPGA